MKIEYTPLWEPAAMTHGEVAAILAADSPDGEWWAQRYLFACIRVIALQAVDRGVRVTTRSP